MGRDWSDSRDSSLLKCAFPEMGPNFVGEPVRSERDDQLRARQVMLMDRLVSIVTSAINAEPALRGAAPVGTSKSMAQELGSSSSGGPQVCHPGCAAGLPLEGAPLSNLSKNLFAKPTRMSVLKPTPAVAHLRWSTCKRPRS